MKGATAPLLVGRPGAMVPLDDVAPTNLALAALRNCDVFDQVKFAAWVATRPGDVQRLAQRRPPNRVYRVVSDAEKATGRGPMLLGIICGYQTAEHGLPAMATVHVLGVGEGVGSMRLPVAVTADYLEDVTERVRTRDATLELDALTVRLAGGAEP